MESTPLGKVRFGEIGRILYLKVYPDALAVEDISIPMRDILQIRVIENLAHFFSHSFGSKVAFYDLEVRTTGRILTFSNTGLYPDSEALQNFREIFNQIHDDLEIEIVSPVAEISFQEEHTGSFQLFPEYFRVKSGRFDWPDQTRLIPRGMVQEVKILKMGGLFSNLIFIIDGESIPIHNCLNSDIDGFLDELSKFQSGIAVIRKEPLKTVKYQAKGWVEGIFLFDDAVMWEKQYIPYKDITLIQFKCPEPYQYNLEIQTNAGIFTIPRLNIYVIPELKDNLEALYGGPPIQTAGEYAEYNVEGFEQGKTKLLRSCLVIVFIVFLVGLAFLVTQSGLPARLVQMVSTGAQPTNQRSSGIPLGTWLQVACGLVIFFVLYGYARKTKHEYLDKHSICGDMTAEGAARQITGPSSDLTITRLALPSSDYYDPKQRALCLSAATFDSHSLTGLVTVTHEIAHFMQSKKYGYSFMTTLKWMEYLVKRYLVGFSFFALLVIVGSFFLGLGVKLTIPIVALVLTFIAGILVVAVVLVVELDADRRTVLILLDSGLVNPQDQPLVNRFIMCIGLLRVLLFIAFIIPFFGQYLYRFQDNQAIHF